jgi:UDPglucose--hexose-1-phosphate uridylyltransferase
VPEPELRVDPLTGRLVALAPDRAAHPLTDASCPFCPGNEHLTPPELARAGTGRSDEPGWRVRVVPNRYPISVPSSNTTPVPSDGAASSQLHTDADGRVHGPSIGSHEVLVISSDHEASLATLDVAAFTEVLDVLQQRFREWASRSRPVLAFVNHGTTAGASQPHPHAQLLATPYAMPEVLRELRTGAGSRCAICQELKRSDHASLTVATSPPSAEEGSSTEAWCPWWGRTPFEMLVASTRHAPRFEDADARSLAQVLLASLRRLRSLLHDPAYRLAIHSTPVGNRDELHWHVHLWPETARLGGAELGGGLSVNTVNPKEAAARLRTAAG